MQTSQQRFEHIRKIGGRTHWSQDFYHYLLIVSWPRFFFSFVGFFILFNVLFGFFYWVIPGVISGTDGGFFQAFLFSVQTYTTIGYGAFAPAATYAHVVMVIESILMLFFSAALTGLIFAKFSRPNAKILFSKNVLINHFDGKRTLMLRMGNLRDNLIAEAQVRLGLLQTVRTSDGYMIRRQLDLTVKRSTNLFFALSWLIIHEIDENSPLHGMTAKEFIEKQMEIAVSMTGNDSTFSQTVLSNCIYNANDIVFDRYFDDVIESENGHIKAINYNKFHDLKPQTPPSPQ